MKGYELVFITDPGIGDADLGAVLKKFKKSLNNNRNYNGYGSLKSKKKSAVKKSYSSNKKIKSQKPKLNNVGYSAYATN